MRGTSCGAPGCFPELDGGRLGGFAAAGPPPLARDGTLTVPAAGVKSPSALGYPGLFGTTTGLWAAGAAIGCAFGLHIYVSCTIKK